MQLGLIGYGKMGKMVEKLAKQRGHEISAILTSKTPADLSLSDLWIDFSNAESVIKNIHLAGESRKNLVIGTTGWNDRIAEAKKLADKYQIGILFAPNFSIGVFLFTQLVARAAQLFSPIEGFDIAGCEWHHNQKADAPSGTGKSIAETILANWKGKKHLCLDRPEGKIAPDTLHFASVRVGNIPGIHEVYIDSPDDSIKLTHSAKGREAFAQGAILGAEWLIGKKGFFTMEDFVS